MACHPDSFIVLFLPPRNAIERLVDDLISESMSKGEFDNLPGQGKPLEYSNHNPLVDVTTHNLNKILIQNGYAPEWVMLKKEIRSVLVVRMCFILLN